MKFLLAFLCLVAPAAGAQVVDCIKLTQDIQTLTAKRDALRDDKCAGHLPCAADTTWAPLRDTITQLNHDKYVLQTQCKVAYGTLYPKFQILTLIYEPPGCTGNACEVQGDVDYHNGSSSGSKLSIESSFKNDTEASTDLTLGNDKVGKLTLGGTFGWAVTQTDSHSETVTKETSMDLDRTSNSDGVNHDKDVFWLLMNPAVSMKIMGHAVSWSLGFKGSVPAIGQVDVGALKFCAQGGGTPPFGLTATDCQVILTEDPFAYGSTTVDPQRYGMTAFYSYTPSASCSNVTYELKNEDETSDSHEVEKEISVGYSFSADSAELKPLFNAVVKAGQTFTWTHTSTHEVTTDSTQTASFKLACPGASIGKDWIGVYWDVAYGTFMFKPMDLTELGMPIYGGHLANSSGAAMPRTPVQLVVNGRTLHTATDKNGDYKFFLPRSSSPARLPSSATLAYGAVRRVVPLQVAEGPRQNRLQQPIEKKR